MYFWGSLLTLRSLNLLQDSWAICRIFKKTNSIAQQRALSHSWVSHNPLPDELPTNTSHHDMLSKASSQTTTTTSQFSSSPSVHFQFRSNLNDPQNSSLCTNTANNTIAPNDFMSYKPYQLPPLSNNGDHFNPSFIFSPPETSSAPLTSSVVDVSSMLLNMSSSVLGDHFGIIKASEGMELASGLSHDQCNGNFTNISFPPDQQVSLGISVSESGLLKGLNVNVAESSTATEDHWQASRPNIGFPFSLPLTLPNLVWDSSSPCPTEMSTTSFSTTKCFT